ncbi:MAG: hypothetical protein K2J73_00220 [Oscillospiraceae bacterium]|nr:hypothetical protein [Oscillospiraceae bacterium]
MEDKNYQSVKNVPDTRVPEKTNGDKHNLIFEQTSWAEEAKEEMEDYIESQGIHIRQ